MVINEDTKLRDILEEYPWLREELAKKHPQFKVLDSALGRVFLRKASIGDLARKAGKSPQHLMDNLNRILMEKEDAK